MNNNSVGYIPRLLHKFYLRLKDRFDPTPEPKEEEIYCIEICKKLIMLNNTKLTIAPLSNKRFIKNDEKNMFIVIHNRTISLVNHVYGYNVFIDNTKLYDDIIFLFDSELEKIRQQLEDEINGNIKHSLKVILSKFN